MLRVNMVDRLKLLSEKRSELFEAAREFSKDAPGTAYTRQQNTIELESCRGTVTSAADMATVRKQ